MSSKKQVVNDFDNEYMSSIRNVIENGKLTQNRTGIDTLSVFGEMSRYDMSTGLFPAITVKTLAFKSVVSELLWFLNGSSDERALAEMHYGKDREDLIGKTTIWTANADEQGVNLGYQNTETVKQLGPVYGVQWRGAFEGGKDQIMNLIEGLRNNPEGRRHIVSAWNVDNIEKMALPPCHVLSQYEVSQDNRLSCMLYQRSCDKGLGEPFNIASYAVLSALIARELGLGLGDFVHVKANSHVYVNHVEGLKGMLNRTPSAPPRLFIDPAFDLMEGLKHGFTHEHVQMIKLLDYNPLGAIQLEMAV